MRLKNKKILLISLREYSKGIIESLENLGAEVDYICDKPDDSFITKALGRLKFPLVVWQIESYYERSLESIAHKTYDDVLIIRGEYTPIKSLKSIKVLFPSSNLILYMWDSIKNNKGIEKKWPYYDKVYTFDRIDYQNDLTRTLDFLPLFYYDSYLPKLEEVNNEYDLAFIGTGHEDRPKIIKGLLNECRKKNLKMFSYIFLPHRLIYIRNKILNKHYRMIKQSDINFNLLPTELAYGIYSKATCIVDIESPTQNGLTMRTIEMVGLRKKLITTNKDIIHYDFYHPNNILVVDRNNFALDETFIQKPYVELESSIYAKYALSEWLVTILTDKD